jgi:hypothetical protein
MRTGILDAGAYDGPRGCASGLATTGRDLPVGYCVLRPLGSFATWQAEWLSASAKRRKNIKAIVAIVLLAVAVASPALGQSTQSPQGARSGQNAGGTYQGYPTKEWQRPGNW